MADVRVGKTPDAAWYVALARALKSAYAQRLTSLGDAEPQRGGKLHHAHHRLRRRRHDGGADHHAALVDGQPRGAADNRHPDEQRRDVVRSAPGQPNSIGPGKRPLTNMFPLILRDGAAPWIAAGASGGRRIMAAVLQLVSFVADFGMTPEAAAHQPRIDVSDPDKVTADRRLAPDILRALEADGPAEIVEHGVLPLNFACPNLIMQDADGTRTGISDAASPWSAAVAQA